MKFQSIFILLIQINFSCGDFIKSGKLTDNENEYRLKTCGMEGLPIPSSEPTLTNTSDTWMWYSESKSSNRYSGATLISSRHFLTISNNILKDKMVWIHNGSNFTPKCLGNNLNQEVPQDVVNTLNLISFDCPPSENSNCKNRTAKPVKAYLLNICDPYVKKWFHIIHSPMIVEVKEVYAKSTPCLDGSISSFGDIYSYRFWSNKGFIGMSVKVNKTHRNSLVVTEFTNNWTDRGGPLISVKNGKWSVIGYDATGATLKKGTFLKWFYRVQRLKNGICEVSGVCDRMMTSAPTTTTSTTELTTTVTSSGSSENLKTTTLPTNLEPEYDYDEYEDYPTNSEYLELDYKFLMDTVAGSSFRNIKIFVFLILFFVI
ncbi:Protein CBG13609 [Caenorhabditis briggsae]|uniref:Protein CBG13609 n=1 Tax=Caenorhabditis briggsae TaxID=6238 RepID=A8XIA9_CAEBR|nr:Protein CBG13609 [Caenorhabditis briggsae]CAP32383.2 Protein CBG13609 [Caenorhabditis briggsae]